MKNILSFYRKVKYYFYLKNYFLIHNYSFSFPKIIDESEIISWKFSLINLKNLTSKLEDEIQNDIILKKADEIIEHEFNLLGYNYFKNKSEFNFSSYKNINWHYDPSSDSHFDKDVWYRDLYKKINDNVDIKYPWELSRFQHLILLGQAYKSSNNEKYTNEFVNQIIDWIENNKINFGINWSCTMEIGIRASNWLIALLYFIESPKIDSFFLKRFLRSIYEHGNHIKNNLENLQTYTSNHYAANVLDYFLFPYLSESYKKISG